MTDGEPHVMASPLRLIAPLYQIHPRLARGCCGPGHVDAVVSRNIRARSVDRFSLSTVTRFFSSTISLFYLRNFIIGGRILEEKFSVARNIFRRETLKSYWNINI